MTKINKPATVASVMAWINASGSPRVRRGMARYGLPTDHAVGIPVGVLRAEAKRIGPDHSLALDLWKTGNFEAQLLAPMLGEPARLTAAQMEAWCRDFDNWGTVDTACFTCSTVRRTAGRWRRNGRRVRANSRSAPAS